MYTTTQIISRKYQKDPRICGFEPNFQIVEGGDITEITNYMILYKHWTGEIIKGKWYHGGDNTENQRYYKKPSFCECIKAQILVWQKNTWMTIFFIKLHVHIHYFVF